MLESCSISSKHSRTQDKDKETINLETNIKGKYLNLHINQKLNKDTCCHICCLNTKLSCLIANWKCA